jgi:opacity protein-like surface antigen
MMTARDKGWLEMKMILDKEMPQKKRKKYLFWILFPLAIASLGIFFWKQKGHSEEILHPSLKAHDNHSIPVASFDAAKLQEENQPTQKKSIIKQEYVYPNTKVIKQELVENTSVTTTKLSNFQKNTADFTQTTPNETLQITQSEVAHKNEANSISMKEIIENSTSLMDKETTENQVFYENYINQKSLVLLDPLPQKNLSSLDVVHIDRTSIQFSYVKIRPSFENNWSIGAKYAYSTNALNKSICLQLNRNFSLSKKIILSPYIALGIESNEVLRYDKIKTASNAENNLTLYSNESLTDEYLEVFFEDKTAEINKISNQNLVNSPGLIGAIGTKLTYNILFPRLFIYADMSYLYADLYKPTNIQISSSQDIIGMSGDVIIQRNSTFNTGIGIKYAPSKKLALSFGYNKSLNPTFDFGTLRAKENKLGTIACGVEYGF